MHLHVVVESFTLIAIHYPDENNTFQISHIHFLTRGGMVFVYLTIQNSQT